MVTEPGPLVNRPDNPLFTRYFSKSDEISRLEFQIRLRNIVIVLMFFLLLMMMGVVFDVGG